MIYCNVTSKLARVTVVTVTIVTAKQIFTVAVATAERATIAAVATAGKTATVELPWQQKKLL